MTQNPPSASIPPTSGPTPTPGTPPKKRSWLKIILIALGVIALLVVALILLIPTIVSSPAVVNGVLGKVNATIPGKVQVKGLSLAWFSGQSITGLVITGADGKTIVSIDQIDVPDLRLYSPMNAGTIKITKPVIHFEGYADGTNNFAKAFTPANSSSQTTTTTTTTSSAQPVKIPQLPNLELTDGEITAVMPGQPDVAITGLNLAIDAKDAKAIAIDLKSSFSRGDMSGALDAKTKILDLVDASSTLQVASIKTSGDVNVHVDASKPTDPMTVKLNTVAGPIVDAGLHLDGPDIALWLKSERLNITGTVDIAPAKISMKQPLKITLTTTPQTYAALTKADSAAGNTASNPDAAATPLPTLLAPFDTTLTVSRLELPSAAGAYDWHKTAVDSTLTIGEIALDLHGTAGKIAWKDTNVTIHSDAIDSAVSVKATGGSDQAGKLDASVDVTNALDDKARKLGASATISDLPVIFIDTLAGQQGKLVKTLGDKIDSGGVTAKIDPGVNGAAGDISFGASIKSKNLNLALNGAKVGNVINITDDTSIDFTLTPEAAAAWNTSPAAPTLTQALSIKTTVSGVHVVMTPPAPAPGAKAAIPVDMAQTKAMVTVTTTGGAIKLPSTGRIIALGTNTAIVDARDLSKDLKLSFDSVLKIAGAGKYPGSDLTTSISADIHDLSLADGSPNVLTTNIDFGVAVSGIPLDLLMDLKPVAAAPNQTIDQARAAAEAQKEQLIALVGPTFDVSLKTDKNSMNLGGGDPTKLAVGVTATMKSKNISALIEAAFAKQILDISNESNIQFTLTPEAAAALNNNPDAPLLTTPIAIRTGLSDVHLVLVQPPTPAPGPGSDAKPAMTLDTANSKAMITVTTTGGSLKLASVGRTVTLNQNKVVLDARDFSKDLKLSLNSGFKISGAGSAAASDVKAGLAVDIHDLSMANGSPNVLNTNIDIDASLSGIPLDMMMDLKPVAPAPGTNQTMDQAKAAAAAQKAQLLALVGPTFDAQFKTTKGSFNLNGGDPAKIQIGFSAAMKSKNISALVEAAYARQNLDVADDTNVQFTLTPEAAALLNTTPGSPALTAPITISTGLSGVHVVMVQPPTPAGPNAVKPAMTVDPASSKALITVTTSAGGALKAASGRILTLGQAKVVVDATNWSKDLKLSLALPFKATGSSKYPDADAKVGLTVDIHNLALVNGTMNLLTTPIDITESTTALPIDAMMDLKPITPLQGQSMDDAKAAAEAQKASAVGAVGPTLDSSFKTTVNLAGNDLNKMTVTGELHASGANVKLDAPGFAIANGLFSLTQNAVGSFKVTPELTNQFLSKIDPIFSDAQSGRNPIVMTIMKGQIAPVQYSDFKTVTVNGTIAPDQLTLKKSPTMAGLTTALNAVGGHLSEADPYTATFTTCTFSVKDGQILTNDVWIDTGDLLLGTQARVFQDPSDPKQFNAEVVFGLPGETVRQIPKLSSKIPATALYEIAAAGPAASVKPDWVRFVTDTLAPILATQVGGRAGQIAGLVGDLSGKVMNNSGSGSGPTPASFPWFTHSWTNRPKVTWGNTTAVAADNPAAPGAAPAATPAAPAKKPTTDQLIDTGFGLLNGLGKKK